MFEWDDAKNQANIAKHGISFNQAARIFDGPVYTVVDDRFDYGETRWQSIGLIGNATIVVVIHTDRNGVTRIISARRADREERRDYKAKVQPASAA